MKKILLTILLIITAIPTQAQSFSDLSIGPYIGTSAGLNGGELHHGRRNAVGFAGLPDIGVTGFMFMSDVADLALSVDLGLSTYAYTVKSAVESKSFTPKFGYITFGPNLFLTYFNFGIHFGYPVFAYYDETINTDHVNIMAELRLGATYPLLIDEDGKLNVFLNVGYMLTSLYSDYEKNDPLKEDLWYPNARTSYPRLNPRILSVTIGFNYLFDIMLTKKNSK